MYDKDMALLNPNSLLLGLSTDNNFIFILIPMVWAHALEVGWYLPMLLAP